VRLAESWHEVEQFARTLAPVFAEMARVLGTAGVCCIETKDLKYGDFRLPLAALQYFIKRFVL
jgi:hypothetical protein